MDRDVVLAEKKYLAEYSAARSEIDIDHLRRKAIEQFVSGENGLLLHHLTIHRDDTMGVLNALSQKDQVNAQARAKLLEQFKDRLLPEELDSFAELLIRHTKDAIERPSAPQIGQPHVPPGIVAGSTEPKPTPAKQAPAGPLRTTPPNQETNTERRYDEESRPQLPHDSGVKW
jgi:hypothetical protein